MFRNFWFKKNFFCSAALKPPRFTLHHYSNYSMGESRPHSLQQSQQPTAKKTIVTTTFLVTTFAKL
jgi:hypothetical protein